MDAIDISPARLVRWHPPVPIETSKQCRRIWRREQNFKEWPVFHFQFIKRPFVDQTQSIVGARERARRMDVKPNLITLNADHVDAVSVRAPESFCPLQSSALQYFQRQSVGS